MSEEYGITKTGINIKRLDTIIEEIHSDLSLSWGFNTREKTQSFINVLVTNFADKIATLWEFGQDIYNSKYPFSAEGVNLDNAVAYGGIQRKEARQTIYSLHCECIDNTTIPANSIVRSNTNPSIQFQTKNPQTVTKSSFYSAKITVPTEEVEDNAEYTVNIDGNNFTIKSGIGASKSDILSALANAIVLPNLNVSYANNVLYISGDNSMPTATHYLSLSSNLTTSTIIGIVDFYSIQYGDFELPNGTITIIQTQVTNFLNVTNLIPRIAGNLQETDEQLRKSYVDKIFMRSSSMNESIKSHILNNVQGVTYCYVKDNPNDVMDIDGRPPHSVEVVVNGGSDTAIAMEILGTKASGIATYGTNTTVTLTLDGGEEYDINFTRPENKFVWFKVAVSANSALPANYEETIKNAITSEMSNLSIGGYIAPQKFVVRIFNDLPQCTNVQILACAKSNATDIPNDYEYSEEVIKFTIRDKANTDNTRIEVTTLGI